MRAGSGARGRCPGPAGCPRRPVGPGLRPVPAAAAAGPGPRPGAEAATSAGSAAKAKAAAADVIADVVVTRERGKNGPVLARLAGELPGAGCREVPLVEARPGPDRGRLPGALRAGGLAWVVVSSPEAAAVLAEDWRAAGRPPLRVASLGAGTSRALGAAPELRPAFQPSVADAAHMARELPADDAAAAAGKGAGEGAGPRVLYPTSVIARSQMEDGLRARGFRVERLNTYTTAKVAELAPEAEATLRAARVVAFASPSAVRACVALLGSARADRITAACIGKTSADEAAKQGIRRVYFPERPGLEGWVAAIRDALAAAKNEESQSSD